MLGAEQGIKICSKTQQDEKSLLVGAIRETIMEELALILDLRPKRKQSLLNSIPRWLSEEMGPTVARSSHFSK